MVIDGSWYADGTEVDEGARRESVGEVMARRGWNGSS